MRIVLQLVSSFAPAQSDARVRAAKKNQHSLKYLIYSANSIMYKSPQVAGPIVGRQLTFGETSLYFMINLQNHRRCPAGGF
jgi:hypothetical protein